MEDRSFSNFRLYPDPAAMPFDDTPADGETDPCSRVFFPGMEPLEDLEDLVPVRRIDADPVVANRKDPFVVLSGRPDAYLGMVLSPEFDSICDEVLEYLHHL